MTDRYYREIARNISKSHKYYIRAVKYYRYPIDKKRMWLQLMGLIETWDILY